MKKIAIWLLVVFTSIGLALSVACGGNGGNNNGSAGGNSASWDELPPIPVD